MALPPKCVLFDLDGTLVDSEPLAMRALAEMLPALVEPESSLVRRYHGWRLARVFTDLRQRLGIVIPADFEARYRAQLAELFRAELQVVPGVFDMLDRVTAPYCIASSGPPAKIRLSLRLTGLDRYFGERLFSAYEIGSWKPDPGLFLHAARAMGFAPADCIVVEDSPSGVRAAQAAGMRVLHYCASPIAEAGEGYRSFDDMNGLPSLIRVPDGVHGP